MQLPANRIEEIDEQMHPLVTPLDRQFGPADKLEAEVLSAGCSSWDTIEDVVVGQGDAGQPDLSSERDELLGGSRPVRECAVQMKVNRQAVPLYCVGSAPNEGRCYDEDHPEDNPQSHPSDHGNGLLLACDLVLLFLLDSSVLALSLTFVARHGPQILSVAKSPTREEGPPGRQLLDGIIPDMTTSEHKRLDDERDQWLLWGPYLAERAWGTVREDYSTDGDAWASFPHDIAPARAYRWNEDGLAGISDRDQYLCFALSMWNGSDPILKERFFGLDNHEGNHGEDVKEAYWYRDATPTHSYLAMRYRYPQAPFPYDELREEAARRGRKDPEYELIDTGAFDYARHFDVDVE